MQKILKKIRPLKLMAVQYMPLNPLVLDLIDQGHQLRELRFPKQLLHRILSYMNSL